MSWLSDLVAPENETCSSRLSLGPAPRASADRRHNVHIVGTIDDGASFRRARRLT